MQILSPSSIAKNRLTVFAQSRKNDSDCKESQWPRWHWPRAAYFHIPFCKHHCNYCDFAVVAGHDDQIDNYINALAKEMAFCAPSQAMETAFIGGGTPTHLSAKALARLLTVIRDWCHFLPDYEFSIEANPATLTHDKIAVLAEFGVNRVSLGVQSFSTSALSMLERDHNATTVIQLVERLHGVFNNISIDLIFGVPGQSLSDWHGDMQQALALRPHHISAYGLTYEKGTRLWKQVRAQQIQPLSEGEELAMFHAAMETLENAGYRQYEISNYAQSGKECRHNEVYWANYAYFGFGMGAASYVRGIRTLNTRSLSTYLQRLAEGQSPQFQKEELQGRDLALETAGQQLRRADGIDRGQFLEQTGCSLADLWNQRMDQFVELGHAVSDDQGIRLTRSGRCIADYIVSQLWAPQ